jgi:hypothetical protein
VLVVTLKGITDQYNSMVMASLDFVLPRKAIDMETEAQEGLYGELLGPTSFKLLGHEWSAISDKPIASDRVILNFLRFLQIFSERLCLSRLSISAITWSDL